MPFERSFQSIWQRVRESRTASHAIQQPAEAHSPGGGTNFGTNDDIGLNAGFESGWNSSMVASLDDDADPAHEVLKKTDVWFALKISALEKEARELAALHADKGQPRHDLPRNGRLELEIVLEQHAREVLWGWMDRVQRKMQGAVETAMDSIGSGLVAARTAMVSAASARAALDLHIEDRDRKVPAIRLFPAGESPEASAAAKPAPSQNSEEIEVERHLGGWGFWPLMILLIIADFFANLPVFVELFPANHLLDEAFSAWEEGIVSEGLPFWYGIVHLVKRAAVYPEPSILAVVVVLLLLFLGHTIGGHLRTLVALARYRRGDISRTSSHTWRQSAWPTVLSIIGAVLVVGVLGLARHKVLPAADVRVDEARQELSSAQAELQRTIGRDDALPQVVVAATQRVADAESALAQRTERQSYARAIDSMNIPIAGLNVVLIIAAMVVGYLRERRRFSVPPEGIAAQAEEYRIKTDHLRKEFESRLAAAQDAMRDVRKSISRAEHLLKSTLLRDWYGKAERAGRSISIFRIENARLRGLDVEDILAFRTPANMSLPSPQEIGVSLERPFVLDGFQEELGALQATLQDLEWNHVRVGMDDPVAAD